MPVVTEVLDYENFDMVEQYSDIVQIGTRNMQNFSIVHQAFVREEIRVPRIWTPMPRERRHLPLHFITPEPTLNSL